MKCNVCGHDKNRVLKTINVGRTIIRERLCLKCAHVFTTKETIYSNSQEKDEKHIPTNRRTD